MWIHNECSFIAETQYETVNNTNCTWICPKCEFFNFSDSFFGEQVNLETENRFVPLTKEKKDRPSPCGTNKSSFISGLKFISRNINSIRGKKLELLAFLNFHQPHVVAIQETKIDSSVATSELFPETCHIVYIEKTEICVVAGSCCSSIRTFRICLSQNWKTTLNQFG